MEPDCLITNSLGEGPHKYVTYQLYCICEEEYFCALPIISNGTCLCPCDNLFSRSFETTYQNIEQCLFLTCK